MSLQVCLLQLSELLMRQKCLPLGSLFFRLSFSQLLAQLLLGLVLLILPADTRCFIKLERAFGGGEDSCL